MIEACPTCLGYVKFRLLSNSAPRFLADVDGFVSRPTHPINNVATSQEIPSRLKLIETCKFGYHRHKGGGLCQN